jgi:hypothetical protein
MPLAFSFSCVYVSPPFPSLSQQLVFMPKQNSVGSVVVMYRFLCGAPLLRRRCYCADSALFLLLVLRVVCYSGCSSFFFLLSLTHLPLLFGNC